MWELLHHYSFSKSFPPLIIFPHWDWIYLSSYITSEKEMSIFLTYVIIPDSVNLVNNASNTWYLGLGKVWPLTEHMATRHAVSCNLYLAVAWLYLTLLSKASLFASIILIFKTLKLTWFILKFSTVGYMVDKCELLRYLFQRTQFFMYSLCWRISHILGLFLNLF